MKILLDTNVILDVWLAREPFWRDSARLLAKVERGEVEGILSPTTVTTLHYLGKKQLGEKKARELVKSLVRICAVGLISEQTFNRTIETKITDFEDAVLATLARDEGVDYIATRNCRDFRRSLIPAKEPAELVNTPE